VGRAAARAVVGVVAALRPEVEEEVAHRQAVEEVAALRLGAAVEGVAPRQAEAVARCRTILSTWYSLL